ncbi:hypothetical protein HG536_0B04700 [Torulaspora globosa]|uniref:Pre-mRNA-splicing factor ISY1 n=1 Tax=Torulaspora globosa TaxID=48254 RepID=A0A7G3ZDM0_9SACH|nr:uncharacterized protein HG536_0B04700 [Torulaspora globosa]QLL31606.1 hypothetical protein HG536_0B04700 [Torulaspora globosa]
MSRNVDKANSVLVRYQELQAEETGGYKDYSRYKRPTKLSSVKSLGEAQQWHRQIGREIKDKTTRLYDPSLNEIQLQTLNDEVNELLDEQSKWEWYMAKVLGGKRVNGKRRDALVGGKLILGKRYFGRAVELPEVQDYLKKREEEEKYGKDGKGIVDFKRIPRDKKSFYYGQSPVYERLRDFEREWTAILRRKVEKGKLHTSETLDVEEIRKQVPTIREMETWLVEKRKKKLLEQLDR